MIIQGTTGACVCVGVHACACVCSVSVGVSMLVCVCKSVCACLSVVCLGVCICAHGFVCVYMCWCVFVLACSCCVYACVRACAVCACVCRLVVCVCVRACVPVHARLCVCEWSLLPKGNICTFQMKSVRGRRTAKSKFYSVESIRQGRRAAKNVPPTLGWFKTKLLPSMPAGHAEELHVFNLVR